MTKPLSPKNGTAPIVPARMPSDLLAAAKQAAARDGVPVSEIIRRSVAAYVNNSTPEVKTS